MNRKMLSCGCALVVAMLVALGSHAQANNAAGAKAKNKSAAAKPAANASTTARQIRFMVIPLR